MNDINPRTRIPLCRCGSGHDRRPLYDARGIFCTYVCSKCELVERKRYRPEIFRNPEYQTPEPIEPEDY